MTKPAEIKAFLARTFCRIKNGVTRLVSGVLVVEYDVVLGRSVALFAFDTQDKIGPGEFIGFGVFVCRLLKISRVAFQAPGGDGAVEVYLPGIAGTDGPFVGLGEPGQWQLKQVIMKPVYARLAAFS